MASAGAYTLAAILCTIGAYNLIKIAWYIPLVSIPKYGLESGMPLHLFGMRAEKLVSDPQLFLAPHTFMGSLLLFLMAVRLGDVRNSSVIDYIYFPLAAVFALHVIPERKGLPNRKLGRCPMNEICVVVIFVGAGLAFYDSEIGWWVSGCSICLAPVAEIMSILIKGTYTLVTNKPIPVESEEPFPMNSGYAWLRAHFPSLHGHSFHADTKISQFAKYFRLAKVLDTTPHLIRPEDYLGAACESLLLNIAVAWALVGLFNPEALDHHPLRDRLGHLPLVAAFSCKPALYVCALGFVAPIYLQKRYGTLDTRRACLEDISPMKKKMTLVANWLRTGSISTMCLMFVITPEVSVTGFCSFVGVYMFFRYMGMLDKFYEADRKHHVPGSWTFALIYGVATFGLAILTCIQVALYDADTKKTGPIPWYVFVFFEWVWVICLFFTAQFLPAAPSINIRYELVQDADYDDDKLRTVTAEHDCLSKYLRLWKVSSSVPSVIDPEDYNAAAGEGLILIAILSWILGPAFNMDNLNDNPLKDRFGYNNICVAWDEAPALYPAAVLFNIPIYMQMRYSCFDSLRAELGASSARAILVCTVANAYVALSFAGVALIFVVTPSVQPTLHTAFFLNLIVAMYVGAAANFYEVENRYHKPHSWIYMAIYGFLSAMVLAAGIIQLAMYEEEGKKLGPLPIELTMVLDYSWFVCISFTAGYLPKAPSIAVEYKLANNEDYYEADLDPLKNSIYADLEADKDVGCKPSVVGAQAAPVQLPGVMEENAKEACE